MPRIISGTARGTKLVAPTGTATRPTGDKVKEALFSILTPQMPAQGFLDIFAGTGQIGLEAASRGATTVVLVEKEQASLGAIRTNIEKTHLAARVTVLPYEAAAALQRLKEQGKRFAIIFLDPPYLAAMQQFERLAKVIGDLLLPDGQVILEHDAKDLPPLFVINLKLSRSCQYGTAMLSFYKVDFPAD